MLNFEYKGISQGKYDEGEIEALNNPEAAHKLKDQKVITTKPKQAKKNGFRTKQGIGQDLLFSGDLCFAGYERGIPSN